MNSIYSLVTILMSIMQAANCCAQHADIRNAGALTNVDGYRGIWFELGQKTESGDKYSGGLGTYTSSHIPVAIYSAKANKTYFVYGGTTTGEQRHLLIMLSYFDHRTKQVPKPVVVYDKVGVDDPHDNASLSIDDKGFIRVFVSGRNNTRPGLLFKSKKPFEIGAFEKIREADMTYPQPWFIDGNGFFYLFTKYTRGRELYWSTSRDGKQWSPDQKLAGMGGHYAISNHDKNRVIVAMNFHPGGNVDKRTNLYFLQTDDLGKTWKNIDGKKLVIPLTRKQNDALIKDYEAEAKLVYLNDIGFDNKGNPVILFVVSNDHKPGPPGNSRDWIVAHRKDKTWKFTKVCSSSHNYDMGSLYINGSGWKVIGPTEPGPQPLGTGGEMAAWISNDEGDSWTKQIQLTSGSERNQSYARRPVDANPGFEAFWADGNADRFSVSKLYFSDSAGRVFELPYHMKEAFVKPRQVIASNNDAHKDLEIIRKRVIDDLLEPEVSTGDAKKLVSTLKADGTWPGINYIDTSRTGFEHRIHLENMMTLARATHQPQSPLYNNADAKNALNKALDLWLKKDFRCQNWWWNEMGTPQHMINLLLVMDKDLNDQQKTAGLKIAGRANLQAFGARPGGDLLPIAGMLGKQALFTRNDTLLQHVIDVMATEIKITTGRGIKPDLSFHHRTDNVISTLTYGTSFANSFAYWAVIITGTKYKLPDTATRLLIDYYLDGICKSMVYGIYPDPGAENRDMTRLNALQAAGTGLPENLRKISDYRSSELDQIIRLRMGKTLPTAMYNRFFWHSSYLTQQRSSYFVSVRMHSSRASNMEQPHNEEGLKMHHFGDGSNFISRRGNEYLNIFPVWNWQMIPGTTIVQHGDVPPFEEVAKQGLSEFSGGVSDGKYGAAAIDLKSVHDPLTAKKSWFFFDSEYVCLGAGINAKEDLPVFTTMNQALLKGNVVAGSGGKVTTLSKGTHTLKKTDWVLHDSVAYLFPSPVNAMVKNDTATGNWQQITHQAWAGSETIKEDVFMLWINQGRQPVNASYQYVVVPAASAKNYDKYLGQSGVKILSNTPAVQAVTNSKLDITEAVFYKAGTLDIGDLKLTAIQPCMVMIHGNKDGIRKITVSDPTQKLKKLSIRLNTKTTFAANTTLHSNDSLLEISLPEGGMAGSSVTIQ